MMPGIWHAVREWVRALDEGPRLAPDLRWGQERSFRLLESNLTPDAPLYNEFHALIVRTGKEYCRTRNPRCSECPLQSLLPRAIQGSL